MYSNFKSIFHIEKPKDVSPNYPNHSWNIENDILQEKENIYENPNCLNIRANILKKHFQMLIEFYDMGFVASIADNLFVLSSPVKNLSGYNKKTASEKYEADLETMQTNFEKNIKASKKLDKKVSYRQSIFDSIRKVYPDFCKNMEEKVNPEQYSLYHKERNSLRILISRSTYSSHNDDYFSNILINYKDNLSALIDTPQFSEACNIEDQFVIAEIDTFIQTLTNMPKEEQKPFHRKRLKIGEEQFSILEVAEKLKAERISRLQKYTEIQKLYEKLNNHPYIKLELLKKDSEESR